MTTAQVTIFGTGHWALTLADLAVRSGSLVCLYVRRPEQLAYMLENRRHPEFLPHVTLPSSVKLTGNLDEAAGHSLNWVIAVPSQFVRTLGRGLATTVSDDHHVVSASKGLELSTFSRMTEVLRDEWSKDKHFPRIGALSGPNLADEVSRGLPCATVLATDQEDFEAWVQIIGKANLRLYHQTDVAGVELGGALKNVLAIAVGMADQLGLGDSAKAALMTRGLHEMGRLAVRLGANWNTLAGLSGLGDVVATSSSPLSRNHWCGQELAKGRQLDQILAGTPMVVEGVGTAEAADALGKKLHIPMPITHEVVEIFHGKPVDMAIRDLMTRDLVSESEH